MVSIYDSRRDKFVWSRPKTGWHAVDHRSPAYAELMSATTSPGRTWPIFGSEHRVPALARASAARLFQRGCWRILLPAMADPASPSILHAWKIKTILGLSAMLNIGLITGWIVISIRYR